MTSDASHTPPAEIEITASLVRSLLSHQHPDLAHLSIQIMDSGWDNVMIRIGEELALRLPRRAVANSLILNEQKWLPFLGPKLPVPIPVPIRTGEPQHDYPFYWSVLKWLPGNAADQSPPKPIEAIMLSAFLKQLHAIELPDDHPKNAVRDCTLSEKRSDTERRMSSLKDQAYIISPIIMNIWNTALLTENDCQKCWIAGDIHARNVLVDDGKITAFIDWGDMCAGDPATDLSAIWSILATSDARREAISAYSMSESTLRRAKGWAVFFGVILLETGLTDTPRHAQMGRKILERLESDGI